MVHWWKTSHSIRPSWTKYLIRPWINQEEKDKLGTGYHDARWWKKREMSLPRCKLGTGYHKQTQHKATISETLINQEKNCELLNVFMCSPDWKPQPKTMIIAGTIGWTIRTFELYKASYLRTALLIRKHSVKYYHLKPP